MGGWQRTVGVAHAVLRGAGDPVEGGQVQRATDAGAVVGVVYAQHLRGSSGALDRHAELAPDAIHLERQAFSPWVKCLELIALQCSAHAGWDISFCCHDYACHESSKTDADSATGGKACSHSSPLPGRSHCPHRLLGLVAPQAACSDALFPQHSAHQIA